MYGYVIGASLRATFDSWLITYARERWDRHRPLNLHELLAEIEDLDDDALLPDSITILPPENANDGNTDEDSGDEDFVTPSNLPGSQLRAEATINYDNSIMSQDDYSWDSDDDLPLASFVQQRKTETPKAKRKRRDNNVTAVATNALSVTPLNKVKRYSRSEHKHIYVD
nr:unnamed protein product [Callosobruchus chinensis]